MRYWKLIIIAVFLCALVIVYKTLSYNGIQTTAIIEKSTYHKETGVLNFTVRFEDNKGYWQSAEFTKNYIKGSDEPYIHNRVPIIYNEKTPWKAKLYDPFPWRYLFMLIGAFILLGLPKVAIMYRVNSK